MFLFGLILGLLAGICATLVWDEFRDDERAREIKEIEDKLRGDE